MRTIACASGAIAVLLGAFGAHALKTRVSVEDLDIWKTASMYHFIHTIAILNNTKKGSSVPSLANKMFLAGIIIFSGSLYTLVLTQQRKLGAITPIGGLFFVGGWIALGFESLSA